MGYHLIIAEGANTACYYVDNIRDLANIDKISDNTLIFEGSEFQAPRLLKEHDKLKKYTEVRYRVGMKAEALFKKQSREAKFILNDIDQTKEDYEQYKISTDVRVKRSDFIIRNAGVEVDVKCKTLYQDDSGEYFCLSLHDFVGHRNMTKTTQTPVVIAIYKRIDNAPDPMGLYMIEIEKINKNKKKQIKVIGPPDNPCYRIPLKLMEKGFLLLERKRYKPA